MCDGVGGGGAALRFCGLVYHRELSITVTVTVCPSLLILFSSTFSTSSIHHYLSSLLNSLSLSLSFFSVSLSLASSLPLSPFTLTQCPEERGGAFQKPGDHSPLSASGPQSDRGIRIRIAAHSPQCPSDELEGAREGETEGAGGRTGMKGGPAHILRSHWSAAFPLFLHRCRQLCFQVCFTHSGAHTDHTCACTRKYTHWGPGPEHVHTRIQESTHTYTLSD